MRVKKSGRLHVRHQPGLEAFAQPLLDRDQGAGQPIAGQNELASVLIERVEGVEELLLGLGLAGQELDVVDQEHVDVAVGVLEALERARAQRGDELVGECLDRRVADSRVAAEGEDIVADGVEEVGLAEARGAWRKSGL